MTHEKKFMQNEIQLSNNGSVALKMLNASNDHEFKSCDILSNTLTHQRYLINDKFIFKNI